MKLAVVQGLDGGDGSGLDLVQDAELLQFRLDVRDLAGLVELVGQRGSVARGELDRKGTLAGQELQLLVQARLWNRLHLQRERLVRVGALPLGQSGQGRPDRRVLGVGQVTEVLGSRG
ncbi:hypothetical protein [Streptomyces sp. Midd1]|uniref:hypothetical protein n=1 Tax=Streptomyces sp. Midd3 TaxID=3161191 RepID=UPI0034DACB79